MAERALVIGVGNPLRGDDGVGLAVAAELAADRGLRVVESDGEPVSLIGLWDGAATVVVVDAVSSGADPGTVITVPAEREIPAALFRHSTHLFGVADAIELSRALGRLPGRLVVVGVEGGDFTPGAGLSPPVAAAVCGAADRVREVAGRA